VVVDVEQKKEVIVAIRVGESEDVVGSSSVRSEVVMFVIRPKRSPSTSPREKETR
jgi:hypothetical protein